MEWTWVLLIVTVLLTESKLSTLLYCHVFVGSLVSGQSRPLFSLVPRGRGYPLLYRGKERMAASHCLSTSSRSYEQGSHSCDDILSLVRYQLPSQLTNLKALTKTRTGPGVTADLLRPANLFRGIIFASVFVPVFRNFSGFVPGES